MINANNRESSICDTKAERGLVTTRCTSGGRRSAWILLKIITEKEGCVGSGRIKFLSKMTTLFSPKEKNSIAKINKLKTQYKIVFMNFLSSSKIVILKICYLSDFLEIFAL